MAELTGFKTVSTETRAKADLSNSIARGTSPFQHNVTFTVSDYSYEQAAIDNKVAPDAKPYPVLVTNLGSLLLTTLLRGRVNSEHQVVTPNGTFNQFVRETIAKNSTKANGEILQAIVDGCKGKTLIVDLVPYAALARDGRSYAASLVGVNFVD